MQAYASFIDISFESNNYVALHINSNFLDFIKQKHLYGICTVVFNYTLINKHKKTKFTEHIKQDC